MARITIRTLDLREGDQLLDSDGHPAYTVLKVWRASAAEARIWKADGLKAGDPCARVRWVDMGEGDRFYPVAGQLTVERPAAS